MSTVVVVKKNGVAAIGADTLTSCGDLRKSAKYLVNHEKILHIGPNYIGIVGASVVEHILLSYFAAQENLPQLNSVANIYESLRAMHKALKDEHYINPYPNQEQSFESSHVNVLIANPAGIFGVYRNRGVSEYQRFFAFGSGCEYAIGAMHAMYERSDDAEIIARCALEASAEFDSATGHPLQVYAIPLDATKQ